jgi:hypothetical protein
MKNTMIATLIFSLLLISVSGKCGSDPIQGKSYTEFGDYKVSPSDEPLTIKGQEVVSYDLQYSNLGQTVKIGVLEGKRCKKFIVRYPSFEIQYNCTKRAFGVKRLEDQFTSINPAIVNTVLDMEQFDRQALILTESQPDDQLLHLIACYFPCLMDKKVRQLVER